MKLICLWCALVIAIDGYPQGPAFYGPQTFKSNPPGNTGPGLFKVMHQPWTAQARVPNRLESYQGLFKPETRSAPDDGQNKLASHVQTWQSEPWKPEPWKHSKEQQAAILHHKQALTADGNFKFEYASDNGLAAGEVIQPDGSRIGAYQYKDPNGQIVKLKYKAGKEGFQILEGSHLPKSPEPVAYPHQDPHFKQAYTQQLEQVQLQRHFSEHPKPIADHWSGPQHYGHHQQHPAPAPLQGAGNQYFQQNWAAAGDQNDDGQYRENEIENEKNHGPHSFGEGYAFEFQG